MAVNISEITWNDFLSGIKEKQGSFKGGYDYKGDVFDSVSGAVVQTEFIRLGFVRKLDLSSFFSSFTGASGTSDWIPVFTFPNGFKVALKLGYRQTNPDTPTSNNLFIDYSLRVLDKDNNLYGNGVILISGCTIGGSNTNWLQHPTSWTMENSYSGGWHAAVALITQYYPDDKLSAEHPHSVVLRLYTSAMSPRILAQGGVHFNGWSNGATVDLYNSLILAGGRNETTGAAVQSAQAIDLITFTGEGINNLSNLLHTVGDPWEGPLDDGVEEEKEDPFERDPSGPGGGKGNYDDTSDPVDFPKLPTGGALESGAVVAHRVSKQTLQGIMYKLWDTNIFNILNMWQKAIQDPMNAIVSLHALPFNPVTDGSTPIWIGNYNTELSSPEVTSQYMEIDCGSIKLNEFWGSALDYSPYTKISIFLPFIGIKELAIEDVQATTIHVKYHVDVLTGDCIAFIKCGISVLYHYTGNCRMTIPLTSNSTDALQGVLRAAGGVASTLVGGAVGGGVGIMAGATISTAANVASTKINTHRSGDMKGSLSLMDDFVPYLIIHRPVQSLAASYNNFKGYPSNITETLGSLSGYTEVEHIHLTGISGATDGELAEIESLLKGGVII